jgi:purine-binding chemotaxis protein CheW
MMNSNASDRRPSTYLTFDLDSELFAVEVRSVREVLDSSTVTKVPRMPDYVRGVINLRGSVVPVVDLRLKFGMEVVEDSVDTCIIVMDVAFEGESMVVGGLADSVKEVFDIEPGQIEPPPRIGTSLNTDFIRGIGKHNDQFVIILDIDKVLSADELVLLDEVEGTVPDSGKVVSNG